MKEITEISRRSMYHEEVGFACGPVSCTSIITEIVVDVDGKQVFLHGEWVDLAGDYYFEATTESLFELYEKMDNAADEDEFQKALDERDRIGKDCIADDSDFEPFYEEMKKMIWEEMDAHGLEYCHEEDDDDGEE